MRTGSGTGTSGLLWIIGDHLGSTTKIANVDGSINSQRRYKPWGEWRFGGTLPTTYRYTGQRQEDQLGGTDGLYYYGARWYDAALGRWLSPDSIIPEAAQGVQAWSRYTYVNNAPTRYQDQTGHSVDCAVGESECQDSGRSRQNTKTTNVHFDTKELAQELLLALNTIIPISVDGLREYATKADELSLAIDAVAGVVVGGHMIVGGAGGLTFEGNPVTGLAGVGAGWIIGETSPVTRALIGAGNLVALSAAAVSVFADLVTGDTQFQFSSTMSQGGTSVNASGTLSSNTFYSVLTAGVGLLAQPVELSALAQYAAVRNDYGKLPAFTVSGNFHLP